MREPEVESRMRKYLEVHGYRVTPRMGQHGVDIVATKQGRTLAVEVKGDRPGHTSSPGTIDVDAKTLLGQIVTRWGEQIAEDYAIAIRPVHSHLIQKAMPALKHLRVKVFLVEDGQVSELD